MLLTYNIGYSSFAGIFAEDNTTLLRVE